jgi:uncharacterized protein involved in exopolysaccharide biosynthesis
LEPLPRLTSTVHARGNGSNGVHRLTVEPEAPPRPPSRPLVRQLVILLVCAIDGALLAALLVVAGGPKYQTEALLEVRSDPAVLDQGGVPSTDEADRFLQTEILAIQSNFQQAGLGRDGSLTVEQVGTTDVVSVKASAGDAATAVRLTGEVTDRYVADRTARSNARIDELTTEVDQQLTQVSAQIDQLASAPPDDQAAASRREALGAEYQRLVGTQNDLQLAKSQPAPVTVIRSAADAGAARTDRPARSGAIGGVLGVVLGLAGILVWQRRPGARPSGADA